MVKLSELPIANHSDNNFKPISDIPIEQTQQPSILNETNISFTLYIVVLIIIILGGVYYSKKVKRLDGWQRICIAVTFGWLLFSGVIVIASGATIFDSLILFFTYFPVIILWALYFSILWIIKGFVK